MERSHPPTAGGGSAAFRAQPAAARGGHDAGARRREIAEAAGISERSSSAISRPADDRQRGVWSRHSDAWDKVGPPLRPHADDGRALLKLLGAMLAAERLDVAVLGVTPEIMALPWPAQARLHALDHSAEMIATVWRPNLAVWSGVTRARWQALPLAGRSIDAAVGDGSLNALAATGDYADALGEVARVLRDGASLVLRCFIRPDQPETLGTVADAVAAGGIVSFHALKWRIAMALASGEGFSVPVAAIRDSFDRLFPDRAALAASTGWRPETIAAIDRYRDAGTRYSFPTRDALADACAPHFTIAGSERGDYELAERCPTILLKPEV